jgi:hypothetical protein
MRISFSTPKAARAAVAILQQYGFSAEQDDRSVTTDCPTLLAAPAIERSIGLELVEHIDLSVVTLSAAPINDNAKSREAVVS